MLGIARRRAHDALRGHTWHTVSIQEVEPQAMPPGPDPADLLLISAACASLVEAINRLAPMLQEVLVLVFVYDMPYRDVAEVLGVPIGTVKSRLHAARRALRELIEAETGEDS
jgi:RNA polymerase sigma factor (sigma-70 family)